VQADVQRIIEIYHRTGRFDVTVVPKIIELPNNRVNLVFEINEGAKTGIKDINFVGARAFSSGRLKDVIKTSESNWLSFLQTGDIYDPDRVEADRDLLRRFYLKNGLCRRAHCPRPLRVRSCQEGIQRHLHHRRGRAIPRRHSRRRLQCARARCRIAARQGQAQPGNVYNADLVERSVEGMAVEAAKHGYASPMCGRAATATSRPRPSISHSWSRKARAPISNAHHSI